MPLNPMNDPATTCDSARIQDEDIDRLIALAEDACLRSDAAEAIRILHPLAEDGHAKAQHLLGEIYQAGVPQDINKAYQLYQRAADQGLPDAHALD
jgi:TPR repeat protein